MPGYGGGVGGDNAPGNQGGAGGGSGAGGGFGGMASGYGANEGGVEDLINQVNNAANTAAPNRFTQAADLQSDAYLKGAGIESDFIRQAMESLQGFGGYSPYMEAGQGALAGLQEGSTVEGFGNRLNEIIGGDAYGGLVDERMRSLQASLAASGLRRSGHAMNEAAAIPLDAAMGIEGLLSGRQAGMAELGFNATQSQGGLERAIAGLLTSQGQAEAGGVTSAGEAQASGVIGELAWQNKQKQDSNENRNQLIGLGIAALSAFSDPRLKKNIKKEGKTRPLDLISWEWIDEAKNTIVAKCNTFGFLSTQVKAVYPDCVSEFGGFDVVNYGEVTRRLKCL